MKTVVVRNIKRTEADLVKPTEEAEAPEDQPV